jgi:propanol-preferring alcohol dehydrogenase
MLLTEFGTPVHLAEDHPDPVANGGELIDVIACGVCHSDLHISEGLFPIALPRILGHEVTGMHHRLGPVMVYAPWGCGRCADCEAELEMICTDAAEAGIFSDGGYAEQMVVREARYLAPLGDLDPVAAAPLACGGLTAYRAVGHTLDLLRRRGAGARATVIGTGGLGQFALRYLRLLSDATVVAVDISAAKRATACKIGAHEATDPADGIPPTDVVLDFIGTDTTLAQAAGAVRKRGMVIVIGLFGGRIPWGFGAYPHEVAFMNSVWGSRAQLDELLALAAREPSIIQPVETMPFERAAEAHERVRSGDLRGRLVLTVNGG